VRSNKNKVKQEKGDPTMCDAVTQGILEQIVQEFVSKQFIFTSLNVSREAQKRGVTLRHNDMKNEPHRIYADGSMTFDEGGTTYSYNRQTVSLSGINGQPWMYFPENVDPNNYDSDLLLQGPIDTKDASVAQSNPNVVQVPSLSNAGTATATAVAPTQTQTQAAQGKYAVDKRKRLWIPRDMVKAAGGTARGAWLDVAVNGKSLVITAQGTNTTPKFTSYKVDSKGNIAVSRNVFEAAGLTASSYDIINVNGQVVVKAA
jgi:hypothetical protein